MIRKTLSFAWRGIVFVYLTVSAFSHPLYAQSISPDDPLLYFARGKGRSAGKVIEMHISNPTATALHTIVGDCFIPPSEGYQGYVIPAIYPVQVPPFSTVSVQMDGYCTNMDLPALADGAAAPDISQWITWTAGEPLPEPGGALSPAFVPAAAIPYDPLALTYPGTATPFPYRIDISEHPGTAARLLLQTAYAAETAFNTLNKEGKITTAPRGRFIEEYRQELVQQVLWAYAARLEGKPYTKAQFAAQYNEEVEQQMNREAAAFSQETQHQVARQTEDMWASISLVGASAKLIPVAAHGNGVFKSSPVGTEIEPFTALNSIVGAVDPEHAGAASQLTPVLHYFQKNDTSTALRSLQTTAASRWRSAINIWKNAAALAPLDFLTAMHYIRINPGAVLSPREQEDAIGALTIPLHAYLRNQVKDISADAPDYLKRRRMLLSWQQTPWYRTYCAASDPLGELPPMPETPSQFVPFNPSRIQLNTESWKIPFPPPPVVVKKKIPLWIPAAGVVTGGTISYLLLRKKDGDDPQPVLPVAGADAVTLPCNGQTDLNVLSNDTGDGITLTSAGGNAGVTITVLDAQRVRILAGGSGQFNGIYIITDRHGQTATGSISIMVTDQSAPVISCPPAASLAGCGEVPPPSATGHATATDDCDPSPAIVFVDELDGVPCNRIILRTWSATDDSGKNLSCIQTITVQDLTAPIITICPPAVTVPLGMYNDLSLTGQAFANDNCTQTVVPGYTNDLSGLDSCGGVVLRIWTAADDCLNTSTCAQNIVVADDQAPQIDCPADNTVACGKQDDLSLTGQASATDNCAGSIPTSYSDDPPVAGGCELTLVRIWTATDPGGNSTSCKQQITVTDNSAPVFTTCPETVTVPCGQQNNLALTGEATAVDSCTGPAAVTFTDDLSGYTGCEGVIIRLFSALDSCDNEAVCEQKISVIDNITPVFTSCPGAVTVACGQQNDLAITGMAAAFDSCSGPASVAFSDELGGFNGCEGVIVRRFLALDNCENEAVCQQSITVFDNVPPVFTTCPEPVFVDCGQQNNLALTGQAVAVDACSGPATVTYTDDLSQFSNCEGLITRYFISTDQCGNTALCTQAITVVAVPCNFVPFFDISPALCGNCNGAVIVTMQPAGPYSFEWDNGESGPNPMGLCPGTTQVTITNLNNGCTEVFSVDIPEEAMLTLTVVEAIPPSGPSSNNGRIVLEVTPAGAQAPFLVFVNGAPLGLVGTPLFQIINLPPGEYEIYVVDAGGEGCPSNVVFVALIPQAFLPPLEIGTPGFTPDINAAPDAVIQSILKHTPEQPPLESIRTHYAWGQAWGIATGISAGTHWQIRLEAARRPGLLLVSRGPDLLARTSVQADYQMLGLRRYFPWRQKWTFFQEFDAMYCTMLSGDAWSFPEQRWVASASRESFWQTSLGGGIRRQIARDFSLELDLRLLHRYSKDTSKNNWAPAIQFRLSKSAIRNPQSAIRNPQSAFGFHL